MKRLPAFLSSLLLSGLLATAVVGCGGAQDGPPAPLSTRFQESYIAALGPDKQAAVLDAQTGWAAGKMEKAKAEADLSETQLQLDVASNEAKSSTNDLDSAKKAKAAADKSADQTRVAQANKELAAAEFATKAAVARKQYLTDYRAWLKGVQRYTDHNQFWRESQLELAKAKVAQSNNIAPPGFAIAKFETQESVRGKNTNAAKEKAAALKVQASASRSAWLKLQAESDKAKGTASNFPDPMSKVENGTDMTQGASGITIGGSGSSTTTPNAQDPTTVTPVAPVAPTTPTAPTPPK